MSEKTSGASGPTRCPTHHLPDDPGSLTDPYPVLERLRDGGPVVRVRLYERFDVWWVTSYAAAVTALDAPELASDQRHVHPDLAGHVSPIRLGLIDKLSTTGPSRERGEARALRRRAPTAQGDSAPRADSPGPDKAAKSTANRSPTRSVPHRKQGPDEQNLDPYPA